MAAIVALMAAVGALIAAVRVAAYDEELPVVLGALVVGACVSLTWIVLTDVLDPLRDRARRRDSGTRALAGLCALDTTDS